MNAQARNSKGNALPETALIMSLVLLLFFGAVQLAVAGYTQASVDGAAFVAAHTAAVYGNGSNGVATTGTAFPSLSGDVQVGQGTPGTLPMTSQVAKAVGGLLFVPGAAASYDMRSHVIEPLPVAATGTFPQFSANATLPNYYNAGGGADQTYQIYLAQKLHAGTDLATVFSEMNCHYQWYAHIAPLFPGDYHYHGPQDPGWQGSFKKWNPYAPGTYLAPIYGWDPANGGQSCVLPH